MSAKTRRKNPTLACAVAAAMAALSVAAQKPAPQPPQPQQGARPALVVGIVIDGLDIDRLATLRPHFGNNGFNRLFKEGATISDLQYGSHLDEAASTALLFTGAAPAVNGIPSSSVYDPSSRLDASVLLDATTIGNFTDETYSPAALRVSTLADELRIDTGGLGYVHSLSPDAAQAIIMTGHAGNSACWINDKSGKWATTTYYTELPTPIQTLNHLRPLSSRLDTLSWTPAIPAGAYEFLPSYKKIYAFRHNFPHNDPQRYSAFKNAAPVNAEVTSVATDYIKLLNLGQREPTDMLNINYTLQPFTFGRDADSRAELIDSYVRLDRELDRLFRSIDASGPGMNRTLVFVAGTPENPSSRRDDSKWNVPTGDFSPSRAISLLKVYLMSVFGNGDWVSGYHNGQFFLNRDLIRDRGKDLGEMRRESADFLRRMSGVNYAATVDEVATAMHSDDNPFPPARNIDIATAGDIFISVAPGWCITDTPAPTTAKTSAQAASVPQIVNSLTNPTVVRAANSSSAAFILYPPIDPVTIDTPVDARAIAPTIARLLHIRSPNGASWPPIRLGALSTTKSNSN